MTQALLSYVPTIIALIVIAAVVLVNNPKKQSNQAVTLLLCALALWLSALFVADVGFSESASLVAIRVALAFTNLILITLLYFFFVFPYKISLTKHLIIFTSLPLVVLSFLALSDQMVIMVDTSGELARVVQSSVLYQIQIWAIALYGFFAFSILFYKYHHANVVHKSQIKLILISGFFALLLNIAVNFGLDAFGLSDFAAFINSFSILLVAAALSYSIVRHRLFDIRFVIARSLAYVFSLTTLSVIYGYFVFGFIDQFFPENILTTAQQVLYTVAAIFLAFTFQPLKQFFDKVTDRVFYRDAYNSENLLDDLNAILVSQTDLSTLLKKSSETIASYIKPEFCLIGIKETEHTAQTIIGTDEIDFDAKDIATVRAITPSMGVKKIVTAELEEGVLKEDLRKYNIAVLLRLAKEVKKGQEGTGYLALGYKKSGNIYNQQDLKVLEIIADELVIAIENALQFEEIKAFNETLRRRIEEATAELQEKNEELRKLDKTKDDFISMASHQLRTPLTTIKGYLSMLLDGDAGKVPKKQAEFIDMAYIGAERMVHLIADMLNVSRISTGKLTIDKASINVAEVAHSEVEQLQRQADAHQVKLTFHQPEVEIPELELDEGKIRQVMMNFTDNAVYYTPKGNVDVYVEYVDGSIEFRVEDDGIGVSKAAQEKLFSKFFRAENAQSIRPDGTGLGLYLAKQVIEVQDGEIIFHSEEGKGSTFGFRFKADNSTS